MEIEWVEIPEGEAIVGINHEAVRDELREQFELDDPDGHYASAIEKAKDTLKERDEGRLAANEFVAFTDAEQEIVQRYERLFRTEMDLLQQPEEHTVNVKRFYITRYPITTGQTALIVRRSGCQITTRNPIREQLAMMPAEFDYQNAARMAECLDARLPSADEWEKAARGSDGRRYPWGDEFNPRFANVIDDYSKMEVPDPRRKYMRFAKTPVNNYDQNVSPFGVHDVIGNVREWTADTVSGKAVLKSNAARTGIPDIVRNHFENVILVTNEEPYWYFNLLGRHDLGNPRAYAMFIGVRPVKDRWDLLGWQGVDLPKPKQDDEPPEDDTNETTD